MAPQARVAAEAEVGRAPCTQMLVLLEPGYLSHEPSQHVLFRLGIMASEQTSPVAAQENVVVVAVSLAH